METVKDKVRELRGMAKLERLLGDRDPPPPPPPIDDGDGGDGGDGEPRIDYRECGRLGPCVLEVRTIAAPIEDLGGRKEYSVHFYLINLNGENKPKDARLCIAHFTFAQRPGGTDDVSRGVYDIDEGSHGVYDIDEGDEFRDLNSAVIARAAELMTFIPTRGVDLWRSKPNEYLTQNGDDKITLFDD